MADVHVREIEHRWLVRPRPHVVRVDEPERNLCEWSPTEHGNDTVYQREATANDLCADQPASSLHQAATNVVALAFNLDVPTLLVDHAHCEKKAAGTALSLLFRYVDHPHLLQSLSRLAREELRHFEQVHKLLQDKGIPYKHLSSSRYASGLRERVSRVEPDRLVDTLLTGAIVEARSCERFLGLIKVLPPDLAEFYQLLALSEARHFADYLNLAQRYADKPIQPKLEELLRKVVCSKSLGFWGKMLGAVLWRDLPDSDLLHKIDATLTRELPRTIDQ